MSHVIRWKHRIEEWDEEPAKAKDWVLARLWECGIKPSDAINTGAYQGMFVIRTDKHVHENKVTVAGKE